MATAHRTPLSDRAFAVVGAVSGRIGVGCQRQTDGGTPFFLARGLVRGAYIDTEAAAAIVIHLTKLIVFGAAAVLTWRTGSTGSR